MNRMRLACDDPTPRARSQRPWEMTETTPNQSSPTTPARTRPAPTPQPRAVVCPYCGVISGNTSRCHACGGRFDPLSRQATQNAMGPWQVRDERHPTLPGCSYDTLVSRIRQGKVNAESVVRGPTTRQFWMLAKRVPGVAHLLGSCHACQVKVDPDQYACTSCGAIFHIDRDRQHLGLGPTRMLPGQGSPERVAAFTHASYASVERPDWNWDQSAKSTASAAGEVGASAQNAEPPQVDLRVARLERTIARLRSAVRTLAAICVILLAALFVVSALSRSSSPTAPTNTTRGLAAVSGDEPHDTPHPLGEQPDEQRAAPEPADSGDPDQWSAVRARVMAHLARGSYDSLNAGVLELEALERRGVLPEQGVELLERLRTELEHARMGDIP